VTLSLFYAVTICDRELGEEAVNLLDDEGGRGPRRRRKRRRTG